jgi:hypothetical protein
MKNSMKKYTYLLVLAIMLSVYACKKDKNQQTGNTPHKVTINITGGNFSQNITSFTGSHIRTDAVVTDPSSFKNYIDTLYVILNNKVYSYGLGTFSKMNLTTSLLPGTYSVSAAGGWNTVLSGYAVYYNQDENLLVPFPPYRQTFTTGTWYDTFGGVQSFTVSNSDVTVNLQLNRVDAMLEVLIQDKIPSNVAAIMLTFTDYSYYDVTSGQPDTATAYSNNQYFAVADTSIGKPNFKMDVLTLSKNSSLLITAYDKNGNVIASKTIAHTTLIPNEKTIYSGTLFGGISGNATGSTVSADTTWGPPAIIKSF